MEKVKTLLLSKTKISEVDGERRVTFVASTDAVDRDNEVVRIETFRLPLKGGGFTVVNSIPAGGIENVDIPLLTDHNMWEVEKTIGSVRKATFENGKLIFECGISSRNYAQDVFKLIDEGHLDNAFSIRFRDYDYNYDTSTNSNGEIVEVSLVTRGSNPDSTVLAVKSLKGDGMDKSKIDSAITEAEKVVEDLKAKRNEVFGDANGDAQEHTRTVESEQKEEQEAPVSTDEDTKTEEKVEESEGEPEEKAETEEESEKINEEKEKSMNTDSTMSKMVKEPASQLATSGDNGDYLKSKAALADFSKVVLSNHRGDNAKIMNDWQENLKGKGISGDAILPSRIEQIFFKTWVDNPGILSTFRMLSTKAGSVYAFTGDGEGILAKGHKKGEKKADQNIESIRRDLKAKGIYKKLPIDLQDLFDDETGELLAFRTEELASRVANMIVVGAIIGDGRSAGTPDYRVFDGTRGLYSMMADIKASNDSETTATFATQVAAKITAASTDTIYDKAIKVIGAVELKEGQEVVLIAPKGFKTDLLLLKNENGGSLFVPGMDLAKALNVKAIYELPELPEGSATSPTLIAYADQSYVVNGEPSATVRTDFSIDYNQDIMLVERYVGGSLAGRKVAAGIFEA